ncbi:hypothetical protein TWF696_004973 [Orbilia brochopaga]|uniref:MARVEL domain-containing protein n=1 Tax=Orbilia brochopaga TaxID=3140254 RepID=A0AAV9UZN1_9PEZI
MASKAWPYNPFVFVRIAQIFFALVVIGLSGYIGSYIAAEDGVAPHYLSWSPWFCLATGICTLIGEGVLLVGFFTAPSFTTTAVVLSIDTCLFILWVVSLSVFADKNPLLPISCEIFDFDFPFCHATKADMAAIVFEFLVFLGSVAWAAIWFYRERSARETDVNVECGFASVHNADEIQEQQVPVSDISPATAISHSQEDSD